MLTLRSQVWFRVTLMLTLILALLPARVHAGQEPNGHWARNYAETLFAMGILEKLPHDLDAPIRRDQVTAMVVRTLGLASPVAYPSLVFRDVSDDNPLQMEIAAARDAGIVQGNPDGLFGPDRSLSRAEFAALLHRAFAEYLPGQNGTLAPFLDVRNHWAAADIVWCASTGLVTGFPGYTYGPEKPCRVGEVTKVLRLAMQRSQQMGSIPDNRELISIVEEHNRRYCLSFESIPWDFEPLLETVCGEAYRNLKTNTKWFFTQQQAGRAYRYENVRTTGEVLHKTALEAVVQTLESMTEFVDGRPHDINQSDVYFLRKAGGRWKIYR